MKKIEFLGIDLFKLIFSVFVVFIHCHPDGDIFFLVANGPGRLAVPFFFVTAGYLLSLRIKDDEKNGISFKTTLAVYMKRLFKIYVLWSLIYLPFTLTEYIVRNGWGPWRCILEYIRGFFVTGTFTQLWFLPALITAAALVAVLCKKIKPERVFFIGILLYIFGTFDEAYTGLCPPFFKPFFDMYNPIFQRTRTGLFFGVVYVAMGFVFANLKEIKKRPLADGIGTAIFIILSAAEGYLLNKGNYSDHFAGGVFEERYGMYLMLIPAAFFCFRLSLSISPRISERRAIELRKLSTFIYLSHQFFNGLLIVFVADYLLKRHLTNTISGFFIVLFSTILFCVPLVKATKGKGRLAKTVKALS